jgi:hypothetical protein
MTKNLFPVAEYAFTTIPTCTYRVSAFCELPIQHQYLTSFSFPALPVHHPSDPSGQIGFITCSKEADRKISVPLREVPNCRYYNSKVHSAAFVLPEFGRAMVEEGKNLLPQVFEGVNTARLQAQKEAESSSSKKVLLLGSGFVAGPAVEYMTRKGNQVTVGQSYSS